MTIVTYCKQTKVWLVILDHLAGKYYNHFATKKNLISSKTFEKYV